jgi:hypothetical protein
MQEIETYNSIKRWLSNYFNTKNVICTAFDGKFSPDFIVNGDIAIEVGIQIRSAEVLRKIGQLSVQANRFKEVWLIAPYSLLKVVAPFLNADVKTADLSFVLSKGLELRIEDMETSINRLHQRLKLESSPFTHNPT